MKPVEVVVSRAKWGRGEPAVSALLISIDSSALADVEKSMVGQMCCLGFAARKAGLRACDIAGVGDCSSRVFFGDEGYTLSKLGQKLYEKFPKLFAKSLDVWLTSDLHLELTQINDNPYLRDDIREQRLTETGLKAGIKFIFTD